MSSPPLFVFLLSLSLLVLLPPATASLPLPYSYCGSEDYDFPKSESDYYVKVKAFDESLFVQPVSFNVTAYTDKLLPGGKFKIVFSAIFGEVDGEKTMEKNLCDVTTGGCPIHPGNFTVSFQKSFNGVYGGKLTIFSKNNTVLLTCIDYLAITADRLPPPPPVP